MNFRSAMVWGVTAVAIVATVVALTLAAANGLGRFPARELRTANEPPPIRLTDQAGQPVDLAALRGKVVMLTAVYATCPHTCPIIMAEAKRVVAALSPNQRADLAVIAVTIDPAHDTPEVLARFADMHGLESPLWHLVTGEVSEVEQTLDRMGIARTRDPGTGVIDHANLLMLVDRGGRLAYSFTMGPKQEPWLRAALKQLLAERVQPA